jgi:hypothetical protein
MAEPTEVTGSEVEAYDGQAGHCQDSVHEQRSRMREG